MLAIADQNNHPSRSLMHELRDRVVNRAVEDGFHGRFVEPAAIRDWLRAHLSNRAAELSAEAQRKNTFLSGQIASLEARLAELAVRRDAYVNLVTDSNRVDPKTWPDLRRIAVTILFVGFAVSAFAALGIPFDWSAPATLSFAAGLYGLGPWRLLPRVRKLLTDIQEDRSHLPLAAQIGRLREEIHALKTQAIEGEAQAEELPVNVDAGLNELLALYSVHESRAKMAKQIHTENQPNPPRQENDHDRE